MNISIGKYIYTALSSIDERMKVFPVVADFNDAKPVTPFAVYQRTSAIPDYTKSLWTGETTHHYSVTVVDDKYSNTVILAQAAIDAVIGLSYTEHEDIRFKAVMMTDLNEDFVEGLFLQIIQFEINTIKK